MSVRRPLHLAAACGLTAGLLLLAATDGLIAAPNPKDAAKYTEVLKTSKDPKAKAEALTELGKIGQIQKSLVTPAMEYMMKALEDKDARVRAAAAKSVGMVDPDPKEAVPALLKRVKEDKEESVKIAAIQGLANMGPNAKEASKDLREIAKKEKDNKKSKLGRAAQQALRSINKKQ
jgi:HEAT repeat protein